MHEHLASALQPFLSSSLRFIGSELSSYCSKVRAISPCLPLRTTSALKVGGGGGGWRGVALNFTKYLVNVHGGVQCTCGAGQLNNHPKEWCKTERPLGGWFTQSKTAHSKHVGRETGK